MINYLDAILEKSAARHHHLCPRQVLGARIGLTGLAVLGVETPVNDKSILVILETDGCFTDGVEAATGCTVGHRTLRVEDYGKTAATFVEVKTGQAVRVAPRLGVRERAAEYAPGESRHYFAQLEAYQVMQDSELLSVQPVWLRQTVEAIVSHAGVRVSCSGCGEEIINEREVYGNKRVLCRACAGEAYYVGLPGLPRVNNIWGSRVGSQDTISCK